HPEPFDQELREARGVTLTGRERAEYQLDRFLRTHRDVRALAREAGVELDVVRHADSAITAAPARRGAARLEPGPIRELEHPVQGGRIVAAVVDQAERISVRHRAGGHEVLSPELDAIESVTARRE